MTESNIRNKQDLAPLWRALADSKRRRIIRLLGKKPCTTGEITAHFDVSRFAIMRHLRILEQAKLINTKREGRQRWNFLNEALFQQIQETYLADQPAGELQLSEILLFLTRGEGDGPTEDAEPSPAVVQQEITIHATPARVFQALTGEIDNWWSYRIAADSRIYLESSVGGRFYEVFSGGGGALYAIVTYLKPGEEIRLAGTMAMAEEAANNIIHITLREARPEMTELDLRHHFLGKTSPITMDTFRHSWKELLTQQLKRYVESGAPACHSEAANQY